MMMTTYTDARTNTQIQASPAPYLGLGPTVCGDEIVIGYAVDSEDPVELVLYERETERVIAQIPMQSDSRMGTVRSIALRGIAPSAVEYLFLHKGKLVLDPAARLVTGRDSYGRSAEAAQHCLIPEDDFDWDGDNRPLEIPYEDVISYCVHVRGYTKARSARVKHPGTYLGLEEKVPYLSQLGINQLILMPAYEFDEVRKAPVPDGAYHDPAVQPETKLNYWGYGEGLYFAPKASYAAGSAADEFKHMVRAMHRAGIEVIMEFAFSDDAGIDYMAQCLCWWVQAYHVDGFVLLTQPQKAEAIATFPQLRRTKLMTGWFDTGRIYPKGRQHDARVLADLHDGFKADARRTLKGDDGMLRRFVDLMRNNERDKATYNYITNHDGFTLWDMVAYNEKHNEENGENNRDGSNNEMSWNCGAEGPTKKRAVNRLRIRQMKNAIAMLMCAQGTPMLMGGDEFANSQGGNNNPWCLDSEVTWLDWKNMRAQSDLQSFAREMIAFRKAHPSLHRDGPLTGSSGAVGGFPDFSCHSGRAWYVSYEQQSRSVGLMLCGAAKDGADDYVYAAFNFNWEEESFALPYLPEGMTWKCRIDTSLSDLTGQDDELIWPVHAFTVPGRSVRILEGTTRNRPVVQNADLDQGMDQRMTDRDAADVLAEQAAGKQA